MGLLHLIHNPVFLRDLQFLISGFTASHTLSLETGSSKIPSLCQLLMEVMPDKIHVEISVLVEDCLEVHPEGFRGVFCSLIVKPP